MAVGQFGQRFVTGLQSRAESTDVAIGVSTGVA
jgi:hypothetical protein